MLEASSSLRVGTVSTPCGAVASAKARVPNKAKARTDLSLIDSAHAAHPCPQLGQLWSAYAEDRARTFPAGGPDQGRCGNRPYLWEDTPNA